MTSGKAGSRARCRILAAGVAVALMAPAVALASGAPGPTGPLVIDPDDQRSLFFIGGGFTSFKTDVEFDELDYHFDQQAIALTVGTQLGRSWSVTLALGLILGGELEVNDREFDIDQGYMANLQVVRQWTFGARDQWWVAGELAGGIATATSAEEIEVGVEIGEERVDGFDARLGALGGYEIANVFRPYAVVRGFIGPINWTIDGDDETGTDKYFFQLGAGINIDVPLGFSIGLEGAFLGEQRVAFGVVTKI